MNTEEILNNIRYKYQKKFSALGCMFSYMSCYENNPDISDFKNRFGYTDNRECWNAYNSCKETSEYLHRMFTNEEIELLSNYFNKNPESMKMKQAVDNYEVN